MFFNVLQYFISYKKYSKNKLINKWIKNQKKI